MGSPGDTAPSAGPWQHCMSRERQVQRRRLGRVLAPSRRYRPIPPLPCPPPAAARAATPQPSTRRTSSLLVAAFAQSSSSCPAWRSAGASDHTYERVLRYPDGKERRIRYPLPPAEDPRCEDLTDGCWADTCWEPREAWRGFVAAGGSGGGRAAPPAPALSPDTAAAPAAFVPEKPAEVSAWGGGRAGIVRPLESLQGRWGV